MKNFLEKNDKDFYFKIYKTTVDDFISNRPMENANKVVQYCKGLENMGYHKEPSITNNTVVIEFKDAITARKFKQYLEATFVNTKGIAQFLIQSNQNSPITTFKITVNAINNIVSNLPSKANSSLDLSAPSNIGRKDFH